MDLCYCTYMARKKSTENLAKVISSNISIEDFDVLQKYTKIYYNQNMLKQPTISHLVRYILNKWANQNRIYEEQNRKKPTNLYRPGLTYIRKIPGLPNKTKTIGA